MNSYLKAIGFSKYKTQKKWNQLITQVIEEPTEKYIAAQDGKEVIMEYYKSYGDRFGVIVRGTLDEKKEILVKTFDPYVEAKYTLDVLEVDIEDDEEEGYYAVCEEEHTGTEIIFQLQNVIDYLDVNEMRDASIEGIKIVGLGIEGKIILPVEKDEIEKILEEEENEWYKDLIKRARDGDEEAQELLDIEAEETAEMIQERLKYEDLFSIVEGYFLPYGDFDTSYSVLGSIRDIEEFTNIETKEKLYCLYINSMGINFEVCINEKDLVGIPSIGMRFIGVCWLQGQVIFC